MQWLQHPNQSTVDNLNNVRRENNRPSMNKKEEYLHVIIDGFETHSKKKYTRHLYRGIREFKKCYQPRTNTVKLRKTF